MHQVPTAVWNEIAKAQPLSQPWATLFRLSPEELTKQLPKLVDDPIEAQGADNSTVLAYRLVAPLLQETEAISAYLEETKNPNLRASLPEINSVNEALLLASAEYRLNPSQQSLLRKLLNRLMTP
jgi:phosphoglycerate-specific signal transduction histidine kinase